MGRYGPKLEQKGALLGRVVDIGSELFAISSACVYAETIGREHPERRESARELAALFCTQATRRADEKFKALWANDDDAQYATAQKVLEGGFEWFEEGVPDPAGEGVSAAPNSDPAEVGA